MDTFIEKTNQLIEKIHAITELIYQQKTHEAMGNMESLLADILTIADMIAGIENLDSTQLVTILTETLKAMESADYVMMADIMKYDMIEVLEEYRDTVQ